MTRSSSAGKKPSRFFTRFLLHCKVFPGPDFYNFGVLIMFKQRRFNVMCWHCCHSSREVSFIHPGLPLQD